MSEIINHRIADFEISRELGKIKIFKESPEIKILVLKFLFKINDEDVSDDEIYDRLPSIDFGLPRF